jgi:predicted dehydrogenase
MCSASTPPSRRSKALVAAGELGTVRYIHSHRVGLGKFHAENDALWDIAPHDLSLILALTGEKPISVRGVGSAMLNRLSDFAHLHLQFPGGVRSHVFTSRLNPYRERKLTVIGSKAMAVFDDVAPWNQKLAVFRHKLWEDDNGWQSEMVDPDYVDLPRRHAADARMRPFSRVHPRRNRAAHPGRRRLSVIEILSEGTVRHD